MLDGAEYEPAGFALNSGETSVVSRCALRWAPAEEGGVLLHVYLYADRAALLLHTPVPISPSFNVSLATLRAVALRAA